ncbi:MAG TPA: hypothetical protein VF576_09355 [Rubricoccaceae bacterium]|jgi:hypothetical protein
MPQTLLALLALVVASLLSFNVKDSTKGTYENQVHDELEMTAAAIALQVMETAEERPFDQRSTPAGIAAANDYLPLQLGAEFSPWTSFGGVACNVDSLWTTTSCDDLDDLAGITRQYVPFQMRSSFSGSTERKRFIGLEVSIDIEYVLDEDWTVESAFPTTHKRVRIDVYIDENVSTQRDRSVPLATIQRVVGYDDRKAARDFQRATGRLPAGYTETTS